MKARGGALLVAIGARTVFKCGRMHATEDVLGMGMWLLRARRLGRVRTNVYEA